MGIYAINSEASRISNPSSARRQPGLERLNVTKTLNERAGQAVGRINGKKHNPCDREHDEKKRPD